MNEEQTISKKNKILLISIISIVVLIIIGFVITALIINNKNRKLFSDDTYVVIYQYEVKDFNIVEGSIPKVIYREKFTNDLKYDEIIYMNDGESFNRVVIENGTIKITEANCYNKTCQKITIDAKNVLAYRAITCAPHGLVIELEERK